MATSHSPGSSVSSVLGTFELLESILVCLPIKDLFIVQRVDRTWRSVIERSRGIRRSMFLLADSFIPPDTNFHDFLKPASTRSFYRGCMTINPAFKVVKFRSGHRTFIDWATYKIYESRDSLEIVVNLKKPEYMKGGRGSLLPDVTWKKMLVTHPPVVAMNYYGPQFQEMTRSGINTICDVYNPQGITFEDLYTVRDKVIDAWEKQTGQNYRWLDRFQCWLRLPSDDGARTGKFEACSVPEDERKGGCYCAKSLLEARDL